MSFGILSGRRAWEQTRSHLFAFVRICSQLIAIASTIHHHDQYIAPHDQHAQLRARRGSKGCTTGGGPQPTLEQNSSDSTAVSLHYHADRYCARE